MKNRLTFLSVVFQVWILTAIFSAAGLYLLIIDGFDEKKLFGLGIVFIATIGCSIPAFIILLIFTYFINRSPIGWHNKISRFVVLCCIISAAYASLAALFKILLLGHGMDLNGFITNWLLFFALLIGCSMLSCAILLKRSAAFFH